ncbi:MAG: hypothetical protein ACE37F_15060 [Nannocystaceae bacterium]|nr:hypothetical protein [bacterium]
MCAARSRPRGPGHGRTRPLLALLGVLAAVPSRASAADAEPAGAAEPGGDPPSSDRPAGPPDGRAFALGVEGTILTTPPLRTRVVYVDPRFVGRSTALGGLGVFGRYRPLSFIGFDANIRTGSMRLRARDNDTTISTDQVLADLGALLYLGRGKVSQFALSGGLGGQLQRVRYELDSGLRGRQSFGAFTIRVGAEAEFLVNRVAFVLSFRTYGVVTPRKNARSQGALFEQRSGEDTYAPVATFQTYLAGSAGIAYRF